ncbi:MAG: GTP-binding protein, partial [Clostridiales bacterium]
MNVWHDQKMAIIVNEFGDAGMDGVILAREGIKLTEINNGSIFCTCRAEHFIEALVEMTKLDVSLVLVESSGLANPAGIGKIIALVQKMTNDSFDYGGSLTLVDALGFWDVRYTSVMAQQQVICSDLLVINKIDLADPTGLDEIEAELRKMNPYANIIRTSFAKIDREVFEQMDGHYSASDRNWGGGKVIGTQKWLFSLQGEYRENEIEMWLKLIAPYLYRVKGFVKIDGSWRYIDSTNTLISIKHTKIEPEEDMVVVLASGNQPVKEKMDEAWQQV